MKKYILITLLIITLFSIKIPKYVELNDLMIIDDIGIDCTDKYTLYFREIVPRRDDNGLEYNYKIHKTTSNNLNNAYEEMLKKNKKIYLKDINRIITNCKKDKISKFFNIKIDKIKHYDDIKKGLND